MREGTRLPHALGNHKLFWLQIDSDFTLRLRWVRSEDNAEADELSRPDVGEYVILAKPYFERLLGTLGGIDMDLMATPDSA